MLNIEIEFDTLLKVVDQLSAEQKRELRARLDADWSERFGAALNEIHAVMPIVSEAELQADVDAAVNEMRQGNK